MKEEAWIKIKFSWVFDMTSNGSARGRHDTSSTQPAKLTWSEESPTQYKCWANSPPWKYKVEFYLRRGFAN